MPRKIIKSLLIAIVAVVVFVVLVVLFVDRDETGRIKISFNGGKQQISDQGFNDLIQNEISMASISEINWGEKYNEALSKKNATEKGQVVNVQKTNTIESGPNKDQKAFEKFVKYLQSSDAKLDESKNPLELAIQYRDQGQVAKIDALVNELDGKIAFIEKIIPPEEAVGYHLAKLRLLREMRVVINAIKSSQKGVALEQVVSEEELSYLDRLSTILKKYLTYFFYSKISV